MRSTFLCLLILSSLYLLAKEKKDLDWQTGTLVAQDTTLENAPCYRGSCAGTRHRTHYTIETADKRYIANRRGDRIDVVVNSPVKFAVSGNTLFIMDANGKSHDCHLEQEALRRQ